jgi:hypothetical protein
MVSVREKSLNSAGKPTTKFYRVSGRNTFSLSPYSAIICLPSTRLFDHNHKKKMPYLNQRSPAARNAPLTPYSRIFYK